MCFFLSRLLMGDELGSATDIDRLLVSSGLSTPKSRLDRERQFLELSYGFYAEMSGENGYFRVLAYVSRRTA